MERGVRPGNGLTPSSRPNGFRGVDQVQIASHRHTALASTRRFGRWLAETFIAAHNERFAVAPAQAGSALSAIPPAPGARSRASRRRDRSAMTIPSSGETSGCNSRPAISGLTSSRPPRALGAADCRDRPGGSTAPGASALTPTLGLREAPGTDIRVRRVRPCARRPRTDGDDARASWPGPAACGRGSLRSGRRCC